MADGDPLPFGCPDCEHEALCPTAGHPGDAILAVKYLWIIFDNPNHRPPVGWLPDEIECRNCHRVYGLAERSECVREAV